MSYCAHRIAGCISFITSIVLYFDITTANMQFVERYEWIPLFHIYYHLGIDGFSMPLIILTTFSTVLVILSGWEVIQFKTSQYMAAFLVMEGLMIGVFSALDAMFFYVLWEAMLIPMFLIIGVWGGQRRIYATIKFFLYTFLGSVFMLIALLYLYFQSNSFAILDYHKLPLGLTAKFGYFWLSSCLRSESTDVLSSYVVAGMRTLKPLLVVQLFWRRSC
ncbi:MAG: proton-conducting transporter membrane subunit [Thiotrichaceae bacterium]